jgi:hypothetical protein
LQKYKTFGGIKMTKFENNTVQVIGIGGIAAIGIVALITGNSNIGLVVVSGIIGYLTAPAVGKAAPVLAAALPITPVVDETPVTDGDASDDNVVVPDADSSVITDPTIGSTTGNGDAAQVQTPVVINPNDVITQAINLVQNNPTLLNDIINVVGVVSGDQNLLGQVQTVLNNSNGDLKLITNGIAAVKNLIPNDNTVPVGA